MISARSSVFVDSLKKARSNQKYLIGHMISAGSSVFVSSLKKD
jgi:hypothetical protein